MENSAMPVSFPMCLSSWSRMCAARPSGSCSITNAAKLFNSKKSNWNMQTIYWIYIYIVSNRITSNLIKEILESNFNSKMGHGLLRVKSSVKVVWKYITWSSLNHHEWSRIAVGSRWTFEPLTHCRGYYTTNSSSHQAGIRRIYIQFAIVNHECDSKLQIR